MRSDLPLVVLLALFLVVGLICSLVTPVFEASDKLFHYPIVKHIADGKGLPVQDPAEATAWRQEGSQPSLYYALSALATRWINTDDLTQRLWYNPKANIGQPLEPGNKNLVVHTEQERFPWRGAVLAVHSIRFLSVLLQTTTVLLTCLLPQAVVPGRRALALAAAAFVAFNPMFLFIAGSVNNDNLIVPLATFVLWRLAVILCRGWPARWDIPILGVALGLAALTKLSGLALLPLAAAALTFIAIRRRAWLTWLGWGLTLAGCVTAIASWWYVRNWQLYGDPTGLNMMLEIAGRRPAGFDLRALLAEFEGFRLSYWGVFGGFNVIAANWVYRLYDGLMLAAAGGWAWRLIFGWRRWERLENGPILLLAAWILLVAGALIRWTGQTYASQGRLLFPAIGAVAVLAAIGLAGWLPQKAQTQGLAAVTLVLVVLVGLALAMPLAVIAPAYARPSLLHADQIPTDIRRMDLRLGGIVRVIGYELPQEVVRPGQRLPVTVYWEALAPTDCDPLVFVHLLGCGRQALGKVDTYPGLGAYPFALLRPGDVVKDTYLVPVDPVADAPTVLRVEVGLFDRYNPAGPGFPATDAAGTPGDRVIAAARLLPAVAPAYTVAQPTDFDLGGQVKLFSYALSTAHARSGQTFTLTLYWQPQARLAEDFQVFVHLVGADGATAAQGDKALLDGDWPSSVWEPGLTFRDEYPILLPTDMPAGSYDLRVGLYRLTDGWRLPVTGPTGPLPDAAMVLAQVQVQ
ncbi:MAG: hypothetical protein ACUVR4_01420 [Anaerolineae bacterium]